MQNRREFLKKALKVGALGAIASGAVLGAQGSDVNSKQIVRGKSNKKEVLYWESEAWKQYYQIAY